MSCSSRGSEKGIRFSHVVSRARTCTLSLLPTHLSQGKQKVNHFANELAKICRSDNMDVYEIIHCQQASRVNILTQDRVLADITLCGPMVSGGGLSGTVQHHSGST